MLSYKISVYKSTAHKKVYICGVVCVTLSLDVYIYRFAALVTLITQLKYLPAYLKEKRSANPKQTLFVNTPIRGFPAQITAFMVVPLHYLLKIHAKNFKTHDEILHIRTRMNG